MAPTRGFTVALTLAVTTLTLALMIASTARAEVGGEGAPARVQGPTAQPAINASSAMPAAGELDSEIPSAKSEVTALMTALLVPATGVLLGVLTWRAEPEAGLWVTALGLTFGPSAGHLYTGEKARAAAFSSGRTAILGGLGFPLALAYGFCGQKCNSNPTLAVVTSVAAAGFASLVIWEIADSPASARRVNQARRNKVSLSPMLLKAPSSAPLEQVFAGLQLSATY